MSVKTEKELAMRSTIFVSLVLASGVASFGASACDTRDVYNQKIYNLLEKYQSEIVKDNDVYSHEIMPIVKVVYPNGRRFPNEYFWSYSYPYNEAVVRWNTTVNTAVTNYSSEAQTAYNNACPWW
jgi:secreted trypsin-like serine protease